MTKSYPRVTSSLPQVAKDCAFLPLALVIAGSITPVVDDPLSADAWWQLHYNIQKKEADMQREKGIKQKSLHAVLDVSYDQLGREQQKHFVKLAVLAHDVTAPIEMLCHLWEEKVHVVSVNI